MHKFVFSVRRLVRFLSLAVTAILLIPGLECALAAVPGPTHQAAGEGGEPLWRYGVLFISLLLVMALGFGGRLRYRGRQFKADGVPRSPERDEGSPVLVVIDRQRRITGWSRRAEACLGWRAEAVAGREITQVLGTEVTTVALSAPMRTATDADEMARQLPDDWEVLPLEGGEGWVLGIPCRTATGGAPATATESSYRTLMETAPFPVVITRLRDNAVLYINERASRHFNVPQLEAVGRTAPDYWVVPEERAQMLSLLKDNGHVRDFEARLKDDAGGQFWVYLSAALTRFNNEPAAFVSFSDISERKRLEAQLAHLAYYDPLTDLPNRPLFFDRLNQALTHCRRSGEGLALLYIDLDGFKQVNDSHGHALGDLLLFEAARRLRGVLRDSDTVARMGGDEFTVLLPGVGDCQQAGEVAEKIVKCLGEPFRLKSQQCRVGASIGIALYPQDGESAEPLVRQADDAMYSVKRRGKCGWQCSRAL